MNLSSFMTRENFAAALAAAKPGANIVYHVGNLMSDREFGKNFLTVHGVGLAAWAAMEAGKVELFQKPVGDGRYTYYASVLSKPHKQRRWTGSYAPSRFQFTHKKVAA